MNYNNKLKKGINGEVIDLVMGTYIKAQRNHVEMCKQELKENKNMTKQLNSKTNIPLETRCQICYHNYLTLEIKSDMLKINGKFCQPCAVERITYYYDWTAEREQTIKQKRGLDLLEADAKRNNI